MNTFEMIFNNYEDLTVSELEKLIGAFERCIDEKQNEKYEINFDDLDMLIENAEANIEGAKQLAINKALQVRTAEAAKFEKMKEYICDTYYKYQSRYLGREFKFNFKDKIICFKEEWGNTGNYHEIIIASSEEKLRNGLCPNESLKFWEYEIESRGYRRKNDIAEYIVENWDEFKPVFDKAIIEAVKAKLQEKSDEITKLEKQYK